MGKLGKFMTWVVVQGAFVAAVWLGTVGGYEGAENVAVFWTWLVFALSLTMLSPDMARKVRRQQTPAAPRWLRFALRLVVLVLMVWHGWHLTALAYILSLVLLSPSPPVKEGTGDEAGARHG